MGDEQIHYYCPRKESVEGNGQQHDASDTKLDDFQSSSADIGLWKFGSPADTDGYLRRRELGYGSRDDSKLMADDMTRQDRDTLAATFLVVCLDVSVGDPKALQKQYQGVGSGCMDLVYRSTSDFDILVCPSSSPGFATQRPRDTCRPWLLQCRP
jgi:hypothetical protein